MGDHLFHTNDYAALLDYVEGYLSRVFPDRAFDTAALVATHTVVKPMPETIATPYPRAWWSLDLPDLDALHLAAEVFETGKHRYRLECHPTARGVFTFQARCSCGASSHPLYAAGLASGWHDSHRQSLVFHAINKEK